MSLNVGVNVLEVDGRATPAIAAAPTSVAAFVGRTERGPVDTPVRLTGLAQFRDRFGANLTDALLGYAVEGFFANGGTAAYVCRAAPAGGTPAGVVLRDRTSPTALDTLRVSAGYRGRPDPGAWGGLLSVDVADDPRATTTVVVDTAAQPTSAQLASLRGVAVGSVLRMTAGTKVVHRRVTAVHQDTGTVDWADQTDAKIAKDSVVSTAEFRLVVRLRSGTEPAQVETWNTLSMEPDSPDYALARVNHPLTGSRLVRLDDLGAASGSGVRVPAVVSARTLTPSATTDPGLTPGDLIGSAANRRGLHALDTTPVQLLAVPDAHELGAEGRDRDQVIREALDYCAARGDLMFVGSAPEPGHRSVAIARTVADYTDSASDYLAATQTFSARFAAAKVYGALYAPWIRVVDPAGAGPAPARFVPPDGHVMGVYARTDSERGIAKAPAGIAAQVRGALDVAVRFTDAEHTDLVRTGLVNGIRPTPGAGIVVAASRTLSTDTRWWFVNVRLVFNFVKVSLRDGLRFVRQEPHTEALRRTVRLNVVTPFLTGLWRQGFFGSDPADQTFTVVCDASNNPPAEVDQGNFRLEVYIHPVRPAETVVVVVGQQPGGGTATES